MPLGRGRGRSCHRFRNQLGWRSIHTAASGRGVALMALAFSFSSRSWTRRTHSACISVLVHLLCTETPWFLRIVDCTFLKRLRRVFSVTSRRLSSGIEFA